jgi:acyl-CoA synthetase (NDP forming)
MKRAGLMFALLTLTSGVSYAAGCPMDDYEYPWSWGHVLFNKQAGSPAYCRVAVSEHIVHKSDVGGVALGLTDRAAVAKAWDRVLARVARQISPDVLTGMAVQAMAGGEAEVIIGARNDSQFGALVLVGAGGIFVEIAKDVQTALAPASAAEVRRLLQRLRVWPLLEGYRGHGALDIDAVVDIVCRVGWLASDLGDRLGELDLNPVLVARAGQGAVVADARLVLA